MNDDLLTVLGTAEIGTATTVVHEFGTVISGGITIVPHVLTVSPGEIIYNVYV
jgi:hypothetical protein